MFWHTCLLGSLFLMPLLAACVGLPAISIGSPAQTPTPTMNTWNQAAPGVEIRTEIWQSAEGTSDSISIVRLNTRYIKLQVVYQPDQPLSMEGWMAREHATALINGGYFDGLDHATALVISNSQAFGTSYDGFGGMFAVDARDHVQVRSLREQPYTPAEGLTQATQCTPMLLLNGRRTQFTANSKTSPRSVVAMDRQGRLLFIVSPGVDFTLDDMATLLARSDLGLVNALNLDGGSSTGLYVNAGSQQVMIDSYVNLPLVIVATEREG